MSKQSMGKVYKMLEIIRKNTDKHHPATQDSLRKLLGEENKDIFGDKGTYARRLNELALAFNTDDFGNDLTEENWKIVYPGYKHENGDGRKNGKVYYNHPVTEEELAFIVQSIRDTNNFSEDEKESMEKRVRDALGSKYYPGPEAFAGCLIRDLDKAYGTDLKIVQDNIFMLRSYMRRGLMADITVLESPEDNGISPSSTYQISPYRIVLKDGYYWIIANWHERPAATCPNSGPIYDRFFPWYTDNLSAFRIDLITKISDARVPEETKIHWTMTKNMMPSEGRKKYITRKSFDKSLRKARNGEHMKSLLNSFDEKASDFHFEHCKDISSS